MTGFYCISMPLKWEIRQFAKRQKHQKQHLVCVSIQIAIPDVPFRKWKKQTAYELTALFNLNSTIKCMQLKRYSEKKEERKKRRRRTEKRLWLDFHVCRQSQRKLQSDFVDSICAFRYTSTLTTHLIFQMSTFSTAWQISRDEIFYYKMLRNNTNFLLCHEQVKSIEVF